MRFLSTIAAVGAPFDVKLERLRLETLIPADAATAAILGALTG